MKQALIKRKIHIQISLQFANKILTGSLYSYRTVRSIKLTLTTAEMSQTQQPTLTSQNYSQRTRTVKTEKA